MGWEHYQTVVPLKESPKLVGDSLVSIYQFFTSNYTHQIFIISSFLHFYQSWLKEKISLSQNAQKLTKN